MEGHGEAGLLANWRGKERRSNKIFPNKGASHDISVYQYNVRMESLCHTHVKPFHDEDAKI